MDRSPAGLCCSRTGSVERDSGLNEFPLSGCYRHVWYWAVSVLFPFPVVVDLIASELEKALFCLLWSSAEVGMLSPCADNTELSIFPGGSRSPQATVGYNVASCARQTASNFAALIVCFHCWFSTGLFLQSHFQHKAK